MSAERNRASTASVLALLGSSAPTIHPPDHTKEPTHGQLHPLRRARPWQPRAQRRHLQRVPRFSWRYHPARVGPGGERNFRPIADAYRVLSDSSLRRSYDDARARRDDAETPLEPEPLVSRKRPSTRGAARSTPVEVLSLRRESILASPAGEAVLARIARNFSGVGVPKSEFEPTDCASASSSPRGTMKRTGRSGSGSRCWSRAKRAPGMAGRRSFSAARAMGMGSWQPSARSP